MAKDRRLQRLRRDELLQILLDLEQENEQLVEENKELRRQLEERELAIKDAGNLAEAALKLGGVFEAAQRAADIYLHNVKLRSEQDVEKSANDEQLAEEVVDGE